MRDVSFEVRAGEIVAVFGAMGAGRTELARALFGVDRYDSGEIRIDGRVVRIRRPADALRAGVGYLTEDRRQGLVLTLPIPPNVTLATLRHVSNYGFLRTRLETELSAQMVRELRVATPRLEQRVGNLSGGNQQKVALARWLVSRARLLIFDEPTRGIDVGARAEVYALMSQLARNGAGILMLSSDLPEVLGMADRVLVMQRGRITAELARDEATPERVMQAAVGMVGAGVRT
ncbi:MAG: sugar ABC transporter ATP-binding protein [Firmicutes bacterium]|nr:sugar ABC transporter ATP-binding protein [Bacillota bacterium]